MMKVIPPTALRLQCPRCGEPIETVESFAGWQIVTPVGTYLGNYQDNEPTPSQMNAGRVVPDLALTVHEVGPCGHDISHAELLEIQAEANRQRPTPSTAESAWDEWVRRANPRLDQRGVHDAFLAGYAAAHRPQRQRASRST